MTVPDLILNVAIGMVTGLATGTFFATRHQTDIPSSRSIVVNPHISVTWVIDRRTPKVEKPNEDTTWLLLIASALGAITVALFFAKYQLQLLNFGWLFITYNLASILSFVAISSWRSKTVSKWEIWCLACILLSAFVFWLFSRSLAEPAYARYLADFRQKGATAFQWSMFGFQPAFQVIGLVSLGIVIVFLFLQSLAILLLPVSSYNRLVFWLFRTCSRFLDQGIAKLQFLLLITSGFLLSWVFLM